MLNYQSVIEIPETKQARNKPVETGDEVMTKSKAPSEHEYGVTIKTTPKRHHEDITITSIKKTPLAETQSPSKHHQKTEHRPTTT